GGRLLCRDHRGSRGDNEIDLQPDQLGCDLGEAFGASLRPADLDRDGMALDPAEFAQSLHKGVKPWSSISKSSRAQETDGPWPPPLLSAPPAPAAAPPRGRVRPTRRTRARTSPPLRSSMPLPFPRPPDAGDSRCRPVRPVSPAPSLPCGPAKSLASCRDNLNHPDSF